MEEKMNLNTEIVEKIVRNGELFEVKGHGKCSWSTFYTLLLAKPEEFLSIENEGVKNNLYFCHKCFMTNFGTYQYFNPEVQQELAPYALAYSLDDNIVRIAFERRDEKNAKLEQSKEYHTINDNPEVLNQAKNEKFYFFDFGLVNFDQAMNILRHNTFSFHEIRSDRLKNNVQFCKLCFPLGCYKYFSPEMRTHLAEYAVTKSPSNLQYVPTPYSDELVEFYKNMYLKTEYPIENERREYNEQHLLDQHNMGFSKKITKMQILAEVKIGEYSEGFYSFKDNCFFSLSDELNFAKQCVELNVDSISLFHDYINRNIDIIKYFNSLPRKLLSEELLQNLKRLFLAMSAPSQEYADEVEKLLGIKLPIRDTEQFFRQSKKSSKESNKQYKEQKSSPKQHNNYPNNRKNNNTYHKNNSNRSNNTPRQNYNNFKTPWQEQLEEMLKKTNNNKNEMGED